MYNVNILPSAWENLKSIEDCYAIQFDANTDHKVVNSILNAIWSNLSVPRFGSLTPDPWLNEQEDTVW